MTALSEDSEGLRAGARSLGVELSDDQLTQFSAYAELLQDWGQRFNLLGPAALQALWTRHFLDAVTLVLALKRETLTGSRRLIDIGSGAGLPGIPLAILAPQWQVLLLEVTAKKVRFLDTARHELGLANLGVLAGRAESVAHDPTYREHFDLCVARAVTAMPGLVELGLPFVSLGGEAIFYKGLQGLDDELEAAESARDLLGAGEPSIVPVRLAGMEARCLVRYGKSRPTPAWLPRPAGVPEHHPLTAADKEGGRPPSNQSQRSRHQRS